MNAGPGLTFAQPEFEFRSLHEVEEIKKNVEIIVCFFVCGAHPSGSFHCLPRGQSFPNIFIGSYHHSTVGFIIGLFV